MAEFSSEIKTIPYPVADVFAVLSDLNNLELAKEYIPQDKVKEFSFDQDSCTVSVNPIGKIRFVVTERIQNERIRFEAEQVPFPTSMSIELEQENNDALLKLSVNADLNPFIKPMVAKPLQQGLDKVAEMLATLPYDKIKNRQP